VGSDAPVISVAFSVVTALLAGAAGWAGRGAGLGDRYATYASEMTCARSLATQGTGSE
jgi:hypothetical protein